MKHLMEKLEQLLELGGIKKDVTFLVISGIAVICSLLKWNPLSFDMAWVAIVLCGIPIILEAVSGWSPPSEMGGGEGRRGQLHPVHDPAGVVSGRGQGEDRRHRRPAGRRGSSSSP